MRLLVLTFYYPPDLCAGSFRAGALIRSLQKIMSEGDIVDVVTTHPNRYKDFRPNDEDEVKAGNINIYRVRLPAHSSRMHDQAIAYLWYVMFVFRIVRFKKYDRIFATSSRLFTGFLGAVISTIKKRPLFLDFRDIFVENMEEMLQGSVRRLMLPLIRLIERFTLNRASDLNCVSAGFEPYFRSHFAGSVHFYTNGIDNEFLNRSWFNKSPESTMVVTYAGNIGEGQALHMLFPDLAMIYPNIEFRIIGNGGKKDELKNRIKGISNVVLYPPVSREDLMKHYEESDAFLMHLNKLKAFERVLPSKIFEYGATGKVVLAGVSGYARQFVKENLPDAICFEPCNASDLKQKFSGQRTGVVNREEFKRRFARESIMDVFARDLLRNVCI